MHAPPLTKDRSPVLSRRTTSSSASPPNGTPKGTPKGTPNGPTGCRRGYYATPQMLMGDVGRMCENCKVYNGLDSTYSACAALATQ